MRKILVTGSSGLVGSAAVRHFRALGDVVFGIDNDMRSEFFGKEASTRAMDAALKEEFPTGFTSYDYDIRDPMIPTVIEALKPHAIIHCAAQPAHDWAAKDPRTDFGVNAFGTLNLLESARKYCPESPFVYCSTSKVYGDNPNRLPLGAMGDRYELTPDHEFYDGITTKMSIDQCLHSLFGASKASADLMVQEYGRYFGMPTVCFRPGCVTGSGHQGAELHGFLSYLVRCALEGRKYTIFGYDGYQVRCNIHAEDLVGAFDCFIDSPQSGVVYNIGGGRMSSCSMMEAIDVCEEITGRTMDIGYDEKARIGDHKWWISSNLAFEADYPWVPGWSLAALVEEITHEAGARWLSR